MRNWTKENGRKSDQIQRGKMYNLHNAGKDLWIERPSAGGESGPEGNLFCKEYTDLTLTEAAGRIDN